VYYTPEPLPTLFVCSVWSCCASCPLGRSGHVLPLVGLQYLATLESSWLLGLQTGRQYQVWQS
jgi:hypothetical protein